MKSGWQIADGLATFVGGVTTCRLKLSQLEQGLQFDAADLDKDFDLRLFQVPTFSDRRIGDRNVGDSNVVVRGRDLIVNLPANSTDPLSYTIYYRAVAINQETFQVEMRVLMQTDLLDTEPSVTVLSAGRAGSVRVWQDDCFCDWAPDSKCDSGAWLLESPGGSQAIMQSVFPSDHIGSELTFDPPGGHPSGGRFRLEQALMAGFLEKGVIRVGRVAGTLISTQDLEQAATREYLRFISSDLPLTT